MNENYRDPIELPVDGILDLHTFRPSEVKELLNDYVAECLKRKIYTLRIIHGKGRGILKNRVLSILENMPQVEGFHTAGEGEGGWGATVVDLVRPGPQAGRPDPPAGRA